MLDQRMYAYFSELPLKTFFNLNGLEVQKVSSRTGIVTADGTRFWFHRRELCVVSEYSRLASDYFENWEV